MEESMILSEPIGEKEKSEETVTGTVALTSLHLLLVLISLLLFISLFSSFCFFHHPPPNYSKNTSAVTSSLNHTARVQLIRPSELHRLYKVKRDEKMINCE
jgi:hypothetical protein